MKDACANTSANGANSWTWNVTEFSATNGRACNTRNNLLTTGGSTYNARRHGSAGNHLLERSRPVAPPAAAHGNPQLPAQGRRLRSHCHSSRSRLLGTPPRRALTPRRGRRQAPRDHRLREHGRTRDPGFANAERDG